MTKSKTQAEKRDDKARDKRESAEANRIQPDKPLGETLNQEDEDFYARQRRESEDGMTPAERDAHQKASPGALEQKSPDGEKLGVDRDEANPIGGKEQSGGR